MKSLTGILSAGLCCLLSVSASALTVYDCVDAQGNHVFMQNCPPGMTAASKTKLSGREPAPKPSAADIAKQTPVTVYTAANCDACDLVRHYLQERKTPFTEKNVGHDPALQKELKEKSGGLIVPVTLIGGQQLVGYNRAALKSALDAAHYPDPTQHAGTGAPAVAGKPQQ